MYLLLICSDGSDYGTQFSKEVAAQWETLVGHGHVIPLLNEPKMVLSTPQVVLKLQVADVILGLVALVSGAVSHLELYLE